MDFRSAQVWQLKGTSGGLDGKGDRSTDYDAISIDRSNITYIMNGKIASVRPYKMTRGRSIHTGKEVDLITTSDGIDYEIVLSLDLVHNAYDGFSYHFTDHLT